MFTTVRDVEHHPTIVFRSTRVDGAHKTEGDRFKVVGELEIRGTRMPVTLDATFEGLGMDPWGKQRSGFAARTEIDRRDWGLRWNQALEAGWRASPSAPRAPACRRAAR